ncbi:MAG: hypothetical protein P4L67_03110 [Candidatus Pacebacteria bacterium]|nr:hypothetical protein [Candidatus Paceibacterota bacterium]
MKKTDNNFQAKRHIPYFSKGVLVFKESGHTLTHTKYYVCSKKQKGQCRLDEKRIRVESLERNFSRLAKSFEIPNDYKWPALKNLIGEILHDQVDDLLESDNFHHDIFDNAIVLMDEDIKEKDNRQFQLDAKDAAEAMAKESATKTEFVCGLLLGVIMAFGKRNISESEAGRVLAYLSEKIYLSNNGKIEKIKLHDFGEYAFQYIKQFVPNYTEPFKYFTKGRTFETLRYKEVAEKIRKGKIEIEIPVLAMGATVAKTTNILARITSLKKEEVLALLWFLNESPLGKTAMDLQKFLKGRKKDLEKEGYLEKTKNLTDNDSTN